MFTRFRHVVVGLRLGKVLCIHQCSDSIGEMFFRGNRPGIRAPDGRKLVIAPAVSGLGEKYIS